MYFFPLKSQRSFYFIDKNILKPRLNGEKSLFKFYSFVQVIWQASMIFEFNYLINYNFVDKYLKHEHNPKTV